MECKGLEVTNLTLWYFFSLISSVLFKRNYKYNNLIKTLKKNCCI